MTRQSGALIENAKYLCLAKEGTEKSDELQAENVWRKPAGGGGDVAEANAAYLVTSQSSGYPLL